MLRYAPAKGQDETKELDVAEVDLGVVEELGKTKGKRGRADAYGASAAEPIHLLDRGRQAGMLSHEGDEDISEVPRFPSDVGEVTEIERTLQVPTNPELAAIELDHEQRPDRADVRKSNGGAPAA